MRIRRKFIGALAASSLFTGLIAVQSMSGGQVTAGARPQTAVVNATPVVATTPRQLSLHGYEIKIWKLIDHSTVTLVGPVGATLDNALAGLNTIDISLGLPDLDKLLPDAAPPPSIYDLSVAAGLTDQEATDFAAGFDDSSAADDIAPAAYVRHAAMPKAASTSTAPIDSWCVDTKSGDGKEWSHNCVIRTVDWKNGGDWYVVNKMKGTGRSTDGGWFPARLDTLGLRMEYPSGNTTVDWAPESTRTVGSCTTVSTSATDAKTGTSFSTSSNVCPDKLEPWTANTLRYFGAEWKGSEDGTDYEGAVATSVVHSPPGASINANLHAHLHWTTFP